MPQRPRRLRGPRSYPSNFDMLDPVRGPLTYEVTSYRGNIGANWGGGPPGSCVVVGDRPAVVQPRPEQLQPEHHLRRLRLRQRRHLGDEPAVRITDVRDGTSNTIMIGEALTGKDNQNSWCHMDNAIATCAYPPNAKKPRHRPGLPAGPVVEPLRLHQ